VTREIVWSETAVNNAAGILADDAEGLAAVMDRIDELAADPAPEDTWPFGFENLRRLRVGRYRVLYEIEDAAGTEAGAAAGTVTVIHVGRIG